MTTSTISAADTALPATMPILGRPTGRRGFLSGLAALPLIGGSIALLGRPSGVDEPTTPELLEAYKTWLDKERRSLSWEMAIHPVMAGHYSGRSRKERFDQIDRTFLYYGDSGRFHNFNGASPAIGRAALVLSTVGCDWHNWED